jgi:preprotein translocase subunit YajC
VGSLIILAAMFVLLWVLLIRPQRARQQQQRNMLSSIAPGDEVLTVGGIYGIVRELDEEDDLIVEIAEGIQVRVARRAVGGVVKPDEDDEELDAEDTDDAPANELETGEETVAAADETEAVEDAEVVETVADDEGAVVNDEESVSEEGAR